MLNKFWDVQIFIHNDEEEFWLVWTDFPYKVISARLQLESGGNMSLILISIIEQQSDQINKELSPCKSYTSTEFIECSKQQLWLQMMSRINCTIAGYESIVPENFQYCDSLTAAQNTMFEFYSAFGAFVSNFSKYNCPLPCRQLSYTYNIKYFHKHSWPDMKGSPRELMETGGIVALAYSSLLVEERYEAYVYDLENLMTSIGGNLGLFLGFSCFSTFVTLLKFLFHKYS